MLVSENKHSTTRAPFEDVFPVEDGDFCCISVSVHQRIIKGQLGVPLTVHPWYFIVFSRDFWGL